MSHYTVRYGAQVDVTLRLRQVVFWLCDTTKVGEHPVNQSSQYSKVKFSLLIQELNAEGAKQNAG